MTIPCKIKQETDKIGQSHYADLTALYTCLCGYVHTAVNVGFQLRQTAPQLQSRRNHSVFLPSGLAELTELGGEPWAGAVSRAVVATVSRAVCATV